MTNNQESRRARGEIIAHTPDQITRINSTYYRVKSQSSNKAYNVTAVKTGWHCTCPDHIYRHICCKHIHAVEESIRIREAVKEQTKTIIEPVTVNSCLYCKSSNLKKAGIEVKGDNKWLTVIQNASS